jgi:hypothetical protein
MLHASHPCLANATKFHAGTMQRVDVGCRYSVFAAIKKENRTKRKEIETEAYNKSQLRVLFQEHRFKLLTFLSLITFEQ